MQLKIVFSFLFSSFSSLLLNATEILPSVQADVASLLRSTDSSLQINFSSQINSKNNSVRLQCQGKNLTFQVQATDYELTSTLYYGLRQLGFLFPHPRITIKPEISRLRKNCGKTWVWKPRLTERGFHLHTMHPSEWVAGYFMGYHSIAQDTNLWLVRNQQTHLQVQTLQLSETEKEHLENTLKHARSLGLKIGLSVSFGMIQQRSNNLIPYWSVLTGVNDIKYLQANLQKFIDRFTLDFISFELGSSEFTPTQPERTIAWMNAAAEVTRKSKKGLYMKVHASNNQHHKKYGNFNFLPQYAVPDVGVMPHTVYFYGLIDTLAPMYHRQDYADMREFYLSEVKKRPSIYYPETSYFIFMDMDAPLLLTDYLKIRTDDVDWMQEHGLTSQINFSTGQEVGYWLFDYQVALTADSDSRKNPFMALQLIGEDTDVWKKIINWQHTHIKNKQLIQALFFSNLLDELPFVKPIHDHILLRDWQKNRPALSEQVAGLELALKEAPSFNEVRNEELRLMLEVTELRMRHSLDLRRAALLDSSSDKNLRDSFLNSATQHRLTAFKKMNLLFDKYSRYPEIDLTADYWQNPTSYAFPYLVTARSMELWEREERFLKENRQSPFFMNRVNPLRIILPRKVFEALDLQLF